MQVVIEVWDTNGYNSGCVNFSLARDLKTEFSISLAVNWAKKYFNSLLIIL